MIFEIVSILAPVFICVGIGFVWARRGGTYDTEVTTQLVMLVGAPCLVFSELASLELDRAVLGQMALAAMLALATWALIGFGVLRALGLPAHTFLGPLMFSNSGNMGLPLCLFAFGPEGLALATVIFAVVSPPIAAASDAVTSEWTSGSATYFLPTSESRESASGGIPASLEKVGQT